MGSFLSIVIELTVVILLGVTVTYCIILDRRLQKLRADETSIRQTVVELGLATERAERAIDTMRTALVESDRMLGQNLQQAQATSAGLMDTIRSGDEVLERIGKVVASARRAAEGLDTRAAMNAPAPPAPPASPSKLSETLAVAEAFAARARRRILDAA